MICKLSVTDKIIIAGETGTGKSTLAQHLIRQFPRHIIYDPMCEYETAGFSNVYIPETEEIEEFDNFLANVWGLGNIMVVVDEAEEAMPEGKNLAFFARKIVRKGRHIDKSGSGGQVGMIAITKRIAEIKKMVVSQAKVMFLFKQFLPQDIEYLKQIMGDRAYELKTLEKYNFLMYFEGETTGPHKVTIPRNFGYEIKKEENDQKDQKDQK